MTSIAGSREVQSRLQTRCRFGGGRSGPAGALPRDAGVTLRTPTASIRTLWRVLDGRDAIVARGRRD